MEENNLAEQQPSSTKSLLIPIPYGECRDQCYSRNVEAIEFHNSVVEEGTNFDPDFFGILKDSKQYILEVCKHCPVHRRIQGQKEAEGKIQEAREAYLSRLARLVKRGWRPTATGEYAHLGRIAYLVRFDIDQTEGGKFSINAQLNSTDGQIFKPRFTIDLVTLTVYVQRHADQDPSIFDDMAAGIKQALGEFIFSHIHKRINITPGLLSQRAKDAVIFYQLVIPT